MTDAITADWYLPALLPSRKAYQERLKLILPPTITGVTYTANPAAAAIAFTTMYVGAINSKQPVRPSTVTWMSDTIAEHRTDEHRRGYYAAAIKNERSVKALCSDAGYDRGDPWYAITSREPVRDESMNALVDNGAVLKAADVTTNSDRPRYTLDPEFAALLAPNLAGDALATAITEWQAKHLTPTGRRRAALRIDPARSKQSVDVNLPGGGIRTLHPGPSSHILKGVVEHFAIDQLKEPNVLFISQPGEKVNLLDNKGLEEMGLQVDPTVLLPDCIIADLADDRDDIWFIEVVATDGPVTEKRKEDLLGWATAQGHAAEHCKFLTAFESRTAAPAKKALPQLAPGSYAWFRTEPECLLSWG